MLPTRFDDTQLPGLLPDVSYVDLRGRSPEQFAAIIAAKLAGLDITGPTPPAPSAGPPSGPVDLVLAVTADQVRLTGGGTESVPRNAHSQEQLLAVVATAAASTRPGAE